MTTMPRINDHMVEEFRRTGRRLSIHLLARASKGSRVVPQQHNACAGRHGVPCGASPPCPFPGMWCCNNQPTWDPC
jgi:hypothetical protein